MSFDTEMPSWFAVYPEFDVGVAQRVISSVGVFCSTVRWVRDQILDVDVLLKRDCAGEWFDEYSQHAKRAWYWLGDVYVGLNHLGVAMSEAVVQAEQSQRRKERAWAGTQRYIRPLGESVVPVSAHVALRDYAWGLL